MKLTILSFGLIFMLACAQSPSESAQAPSAQIRANIPALLIKALEAHGGLQSWQEMKSLQFAFQKDSVTTELQQIALDSRKTLITRGPAQLGFDGSEVWVSPNPDSFGKGSARFYHSVYYYFFAMPFVLADPGINYEKVPDRVINERSYPGLKISFDSGVGDAPDDYYIAYFEKDSGRLKLLLYTVTYGDDGPNEKYSALMYEDWVDQNGMVLPKKMSWYKFADDELGEKRRERLFENIVISSTPWEASKFERPDHLN